MGDKEEEKVALVVFRGDKVASEMGWAWFWLGNEVSAAEMKE